MCPPEPSTEEIAPYQIKTEDFKTSPPTTPSTLSNTESIPDQFSIEDTPIKVEDFDMENRNFEDGSYDNSNRDTVCMSGRLVPFVKKC